MKRLYRIVSICLCILTMVLGGLNTQAVANHRALPVGHKEKSHGSPITLEDAASLIQQQTGGRILSAKTLKQDGRIYHRIKVLLRSGDVRIFRVDAKTSAVF